jgi:phosphinothricin acetyltransferase
VLEQGGRVLGFAYAGTFRSRSAYRYSVETTIYLDREAQGKGLGTRLYEALIDRLRATPAHLLIAIIALPNDRSVGLHEKLGFEKAGHLQQVGRKFDRWIDVGHWQLLLGSENADQSKAG